MTITERGGEWDVVDGDKVVATFKTHAEAWRFIDKHDAEAGKMEDTRRRIGGAIGEW